MGLEVDRDDLTPSGDELHVGAEHLGRPEAAMHEDERRAFTDDLVAELYPVDPSNIRWHLHILLLPSDGRTDRTARTGGSWSATHMGTTTFPWACPSPMYRRASAISLSS